MCVLFRPPDSVDFATDRKAEGAAPNPEADTELHPMERWLYRYIEDVGKPKRLRFQTSQSPWKLMRVKFPLVQRSRKRAGGEKGNRAGADRNVNGTCLQVGEDATMATTSIRQEITAVIAYINYHTDILLGATTLRLRLGLLAGNGT
jgi:hypothetical protein